MQDLKTEKRTMVFYEAPHKLLATLNDMLATFGERDIAIVRELTKLHETVFHTNFTQAIEYYTQNTPRGEFVLIISGAKEEEKAYTLSDALSIAKKLVSEGQSTSFAAKEAANITGLKKGEIYKSLLEF